MEKNMDQPDFSESHELAYDISTQIGRLIETQDYDQFIASILQLANTVASYRGKDILANYLHEATKGWIIEMGLDLDVNKETLDQHDPAVEQQVRDFFSQYKIPKEGEHGHTS
jgi:hypothetical protein